MESKNNKINLVWILTFLFINLSCGFNEKLIDINTEFNLKKDEVARINQTDLRVKMLAAGHDITESGGSGFCRIVLNYNETYSKREVSVGESTKYDKYIIEVIAVDETASAKGSDPFAGTNCTFLVKRK